MSRSSKDVKDLLHRLRGEDYRRERNARHAAAPTSSSLSYYTPSLPPDIFSKDNGTEPPIQPLNPQPSLRPPAGPVPKSWKQQTNAGPTADNSKEWRKHVLTTLIYKHLSPPAETDLTQLTLALSCLLVLYKSCEADQFLEDVVPHLSPHLRRDFARYCAVHQPLSASILYGMAEPWGHIDGELIVVGPDARLRSGLWKDLSAPVLNMRLDLNWESSSHDDVSPKALHTLILVSIDISTQKLPSFPCTVTHLALINVSDIPIHKLTMHCPLLEVLDLSNNTWLKPLRLWEIPWSRWSSLRVLGLRGMSIPEGFGDMVNKGRWDDVVIIDK